MLIASFNHYPAPPHIGFAGFLIGAVTIVLVLIVSVRATLKGNWTFGLMAGMFATPLIWGLDAAWVEIYASGDMQSPMFSLIVFGVLGFVVGTIASLLAVGITNFFRPKP